MSYFDRIDVLSNQAHNDISRSSDRTWRYSYSYTLQCSSYRRIPVNILKTHGM